MFAIRLRNGRIGGLGRRVVGPLHVTGGVWRRGLVFVSRRPDWFVRAMVFLWSCFFFPLLSGHRRVVAANLSGVLGPCGFWERQRRVFRTSYGSWPSAVNAYNLGDPLALIGASPAFVVNLIGGNGNPPPQLTGVSFSLTRIPEPTSFALASLGIAALVILRSRPKRRTS